jgi:hypothetical protein
MENRDARTLHPQAEEELRRRAIKILKQGHTQQGVADALDLTRQAVGKWWKKEKEEEEIQKRIRDKTPDQLKLKYALWSRYTVRQLTKERHGIEEAANWWGDETAIKPECHYRRSYFPIGQPPVVRQPTKRFHTTCLRDLAELVASFFRHSAVN